jgi:cellulose biosynthesis protein BcsQ
MSNLDTKNFENSVKRILDHWKGKVAGPLDDIRKINEQLDKLEAKQELSADEQKLRERCLAGRKSLQATVEKANKERDLDLILITPPPEASKSDIEKLTARVKGLVKDIEKGLPLRDGLRLKPDIDFDFKKGKFKKLGVTLEWRF